jgi:hypothetical protein
LSRAQRLRASVEPRAAASVAWSVLHQWEVDLGVGHQVEIVGEHVERYVGD